MKSFGSLSQKQKVFSVGVLVAALSVAIASIFVLPRLIDDINKGRIAVASGAHANAQSAELNKKIDQVQAFFFSEGR